MYNSKKQYGFIYITYLCHLPCVCHCKMVEMPNKTFQTISDSVTDNILTIGRWEQVLIHLGKIACSFLHKNDKTRFETRQEIWKRNNSRILLKNNPEIFNIRKRQIYQNWANNDMNKVKRENI